MNNITDERKREIEAIIKEVHLQLFDIKKETGYGISVSAYHDNYKATCIFLHDYENELILSVDSMEDINGCLDSNEWTSTKKEDNEDE